MAVKTACPICRTTFSAPDEYHGRKVDCPRCGKRTVVRTREDLAEDARVAEEANKRRADGHAKIALIERMTRRRKHAGKPYYEAFQTGTGGVRHYHPGAPSRFLSLRALSDLLIFAAYFEVLLVALGGGMTTYLWWIRWIPNAALLLVCIAAWLIVGTAAYLLLKCLGELAFLSADVADQQNDLVQLLQDIRDNTDEAPTD